MRAMETILIISLALVIIALLLWIVKLKESIKKQFITEHTLEYEASHDTLTGLANGTLLLDRLAQAIKNSKRYKKKIAVAYLGIDGFKKINDSYGTSIGDSILQDLTTKLLESLRESDSITRLGGDEFIIVLDHFEDTSFINMVIKKIMKISKEPFEIQEHKINVSFSLGISIYPEDSVDAPTLLSNAATAMQKVKHNGRNNYKFYTPELAQKIITDEVFENDLRNSLKNKQIEIYYQLQIDSKNKNILGMEALLRWRHPTKGLLLPQDFLTTAYKMGFIVDLEEWMLQSSVKQFEFWSQRGYYTGKLCLNLSLQSLQKKGFMRSIGNMINRNKEITTYLNFEINEKELMKNPQAYAANIKQLSRLGISLTLDSFATACSPLAILNEMSFRSLKIAPSIIQRMPQDLKLAQTSISTAKIFGLEIIAVGVQTKEQFLSLKENGCTHMQGNLFHPAASKEEVERVLQKRKEN